MSNPKYKEEECSVFSSLSISEHDLRDK